MSLKNWYKKLLLYILDKDSGIYSFVKLSNKLFSSPILHSYTKMQPFYKRGLSQGLLNSSIISTNLNAIWPFWVYKQTLPNSEHYQTQSTPPTLTNNTHRNWTTLSFPGHKEKAIIDPTGLITPSQYGWSLDTWIANSSQIVSPSKLGTVSQSFSQDNTSVQTSYQINALDIAYDTYFKQNKTNENLLFNTITVKNSSEKTLKFSLILAIRPYNPEGVSPIDSISYVSGNAFIINSRLGMVLDKTPHNILCLNHEDGDIMENFGKWEMIVQTQCPNHLASALAEYRLCLKPNESHSISLKLPVQSTKNLLPFFQKALSIKQTLSLKKRIENIAILCHKKEKTKLEKEWETILQPLSTIKIPHAKLDLLFQTNLRHLHNFLGNTSFYRGSFTSKSIQTRHNFSTLLTLNRIQGFALSKKILTYFQKQIAPTPANPFRRPSIETLSQILIGSHDYFLYSQDYLYLERSFPFIEHCFKTIIKTDIIGNSKKNIQNSLFNLKFIPKRHHIDDQHVINTFWAYSGIRAALKIANTLNKPLKKRYIDLFEGKITSSINDLLESIPNYPLSHQSRYPELNPGIVPSLIGSYPLTIFHPEDDLLQKILDHIESTQTYNNVYYHHHGHAGYGISYNCHLAQIYLKQNNQKTFTLLDWISNTASTTGCWPESISPISQGGCSGDGHCGFASSEFIHLIRNLLIRETGKTLIITPMIPQEWLSKGLPLKVSQLPTQFGLIDFQLNHYNNTVHLELNHTFHTKPKEIKVIFDTPVTNMTDGTQNTSINHKKEVNISLSAKTIEFQLAS
ncbi:hypothetical protein DID77_00385 [Candidatus Marinamargulisbacteria bacterium SCGC AG-439-L15]|nr:hypothetical protein DID77_00385 [Candidatus Marinamargulisbacteria bacterium SCGC AG-439-L15]